MKKAKIYYYDIGDYLNREEKLAIIQKLGNVENPDIPWQILQPNEAGDWLNQRDDIFGTFIPLGSKDDKSANTFFVPNYSNGVQSNRDAWVYNFSKRKLSDRIYSMIECYNLQLDSYKKIIEGTSNKPSIEDFIETDPHKIKWSSSLINTFSRLIRLNFNKNSIIISFYRPFNKQVLYFDNYLNHRPYLMPRLFPSSKQKNLVICVSGVGVTKEFTVIMTDTIPDLELIGKSQCFPLYYYEERAKDQMNLFDQSEGPEYIQRDAISDFILKQARELYGNAVSKEDIFYYVYGFLHSPVYRERFSSDLKKMLPRLPLVEQPKDFWAFSKAGRKLAELHINYEKVPAYNGLTLNGADSGFYKVEKMRFPKKDQKDTIIYNSQISISNIPAAAYEYVVNGKSAIEWVMERYQITTHKESGIKNDPNDWAEEQENPRYTLDLLCSVINVSVQTVELVKGLPKVEI